MYFEKKIILLPKDQQKPCPKAELEEGFLYL